VCMKNPSDEPVVFVSSAFREQNLAYLKGAPLSVYLAYKSYADKERMIAWPSLKTLSMATGYGINAVKAARRLLLKLGLLTQIEQSREGGRYGWKKFRVNTVALKQAHGTVAPSTVAPPTVAPCTVARKQCQEGFPSEGFPPKEGNPAEAEESAAAFSRSDLEKLRESEDSAWGAIGRKDHGPHPYRVGWIKAYRQHRSDPAAENLSDVMEQFIRDCESRGIKIPPGFYSAKRAIEAAESRPTLSANSSLESGKFDDIPVY